MSHCWFISLKKPASTFSIRWNFLWKEPTWSVSNFCLWSFNSWRSVLIKLRHHVAIMSIESLCNAASTYSLDFSVSSFSEIIAFSIYLSNFRFSRISRRGRSWALSDSICFSWRAFSISIFSRFFSCISPTYHKDWDTCSWKGQLESTRSWKILSWKVSSSKEPSEVGKNQASLERTKRSWKEPSEVGNFRCSWKLVSEVGKCQCP